MAADLAPAVFAPPPPPLVVPVMTWTGCYLGGNAGSGWSSWTYSNPTNFPQAPGERGDILANNFVAGGQVGCDYQLDGLVLGVQGSFDWTRIKGRFFDSTTAAADESAEAKWFATATGRIGYTMTPAALLYAKGGVAWVNNQYQDILTGNSCFPAPAPCNRAIAESW